MRKMAAVAFAMTWIFLLAACGDRMNESEAANTALSALESIAEETSESTTGEIPENTAEGVSGNAAEGASGHAFEEGTAQGTAEADSAAESNRVTESGGMAGTDGSTKEGAAEGVGGETGEQSRTLIVFFSRWGNTDYPENVDASTSASIVTDGGERYGSTEYIARLIWQSVGGSLQRIETEESYPVDFDQVVEQNHDEQSGGVLPKLKESGLDLSEYDTVFIGYPVWSSGLPQAVLSFLREYDFTGKTVIPFCTSASSGLGESGTLLAEMAGTGDWQTGRRFSGSVDQSAVSDWVKQLGV